MLTKKGKFTVMENSKINTISRFVTAAANVLLVIGVAVAWFTLKTEQDNAASTLDKAKKDLAFNMLLNTNKLDLGLYCVNFIADLNNEEIDKIAQFQKAYIADNNIQKLKQCIIDQKIDDLLYLAKSSEEKNYLTEYGSYYVKSRAIYTLNTLEIYALANCKGLVDKDTMNYLFENVKFPKLENGVSNIVIYSDNKNYTYLDNYLKTKSCPQEEKATQK
jgi:hypothetical protein